MALAYLNYDVLKRVKRGWALPVKKSKIVPVSATGNPFYVMALAYQTRLEQLNEPE